LLPLTNYCAHRNRLVHAIGRVFARHISWSTLDEDLARFLKAHPQALPETAAASEPTHRGW
jgi:hypothetical protein